MKSRLRTTGLPRKSSQGSDGQSCFRISRRKPRLITGVILGDKVLLRIDQYKKQKCGWCGKTYKPRTAHQLYCSTECRAWSDADHTMRRVRRFRKKYKPVLGLLAPSYQKMGTGELGSHACHDEDEELNKIRCEMRKIGLHTIY